MTQKGVRRGCVFSLRLYNADLGFIAYTMLSQCWGIQIDGYNYRAIAIVYSKVLLCISVIVI